MLVVQRLWKRCGRCEQYLSCWIYLVCPRHSWLSLHFLRTSRTRDLYFGSNGYNNVYSFLPSNGAIITKFSGDLNVFIKVEDVRIPYS
jgi:hypothetical protein